jgi:hypothetical protein
VRSDSKSCNKVNRTCNPIIYRFVCNRDMKRNA